MSGAYASLMGAARGYLFGFDPTASKGEYPV